jgi:hypothetical protein
VTIDKHRGERADRAAAQRAVDEIAARIAEKQGKRTGAKSASAWP